MRCQNPVMDTGCKKHKGKRKDGTLWERGQSWFGYELHLVVDAKHELPVTFEATRASLNEMSRVGDLLDGMQQRCPDILETCDRVLADKGYDSGKLLARWWRSAVCGRTERKSGW